MIRNIFLTALRSLKKNKFFSFLNIAGLAIGMSVFFLIAQYVHFEKSFEDFIPNSDNIYRVALTSYVNGELIVESAENFPGAGPGLKNELGEVTSYARLYNLGYKNNLVITNEEAQPEPIAFKHRHFLYADSAFLPMMGYEMTRGDVRQALAEPLTAVISEKYARMYFGDDDPIGKQLHMQDDDLNDELVKVTGVFKDLPENTHLKFDVLFSYKTLYTRGDWAPARYDQSWQRKDMYTFISVLPGTDPKMLEAKLPAIVDKYIPNASERNQRHVLSLQPIRDIHLTSHLAEEPEPNGDERIVMFLGMIGIFVLVIAWINYVNLSTAKAMERANEVGVRKVMGAFKAQLVSQFLSEAALTNLASITLAMIIVAVVLPSFNNLSGLNLGYDYLMTPWFIATIFGAWIIGSLLSGFYPAFVLSSFKPVSVLKGKMHGSRKGLFLRKGLVMLQFMASVLLIAGTLIIYDQLNFMMSQDIGMDIDQVLVVERPGISARDRAARTANIDAFRNELRSIPEVQKLAVSVTIPGKQREYKVPCKRYGASDDDLVTLRFNSMDYDFVDVFQMKMIAGRQFDAQHPNDGDTAVILSESSVRLLGFEKPEDAVGQTLAIPAFQWNPIVVGVVNDYHQESLKRPLDPSIFYCTIYGGEFYSMKVNAKEVGNVIPKVKAAWAKAFPGNPFDYFFLDDYFNQQYENEMKFGKLFFVFSGFAIFVGCLGLFGLSAFSAAQRTKEIGIRKALGSSVQSIFMLLSTEYIKLVLVSIVVATPLIYFGAEYWMQTFPYHAELDFLIFVVSGLAVLLISILTISYQTIKAARTNPVDSLKYE